MFPPTLSQRVRMIPTALGTGTLSSSDSQESTVAWLFSPRTARGGETAAVISTITSTCQRHEINPQVYLTQLLAGLQTTPISQLDQWLPDRWKAATTPTN